jgi:hypothetical protein
MPDPGVFQSVVEAAEQAAGAGDFGAAAKLLQQAVRLQESELGPKHPDLANTLNNLGVVCERTGDWTEAERSYRRAATIAAASLPADHPFVATSRQNLSDFCAMRGLPLDPAPAGSGSTPANGPVADFATERQPFTDSAAQPSGAPAPPPPSPPRVTPPAAPARSSATPTLTARTTARALERPAPSSRGLTIAAIIAIPIVALIAIRPWSRSSEDGTTSVAPPPAPQSQPAPAAQPPVASPPVASPPAAKPPSAAPQAAPTRPPAPPAPKPDPDQKPAAVTVVTAQLCRTLGFGGAEWTCTPPGAEVSAGPLYFYTRLKSNGDVVVRHRWYREDQLRQASDLKVSANTTAGYRTYSRHTVSGGPANWRVELRTLEGRLLHEERFVVR